MTCINCGYQFYRIEREELRAGHDVKCNHCKYTWRYIGHATRATCPNCEQKIYPEKCRVDEDDDPDISV